MKNTRTTVRVLAFALLLALRAHAAAPAFGASPGSAEEALANLRFVLAPGAGWRNFSEGASAGYHERGAIAASIISLNKDAGSAPPIPLDSRWSMRLDDRSDSKVRLIRHPQGREQSLSLDREAFAAENAVELAPESVELQGKTYKARVYRFVNEIKIRVNVQPDGVLYQVTRTTTKVWLAPGIPNGILRQNNAREQFDETWREGLGYVRHEAPYKRVDTDERLTELDAPLKVGDKTVHCFCNVTETGHRGASLTRSRTCFSPLVPGGVVRIEESSIEDTKEMERMTRELTDFNAQPTN